MQEALYDFPVFPRNNPLSQIFFTYIAHLVLNTSAYTMFYSMVGDDGFVADHQHEKLEVMQKRTVK
ncbi:hypothetical protein D3C86_2165490 [compost metagenome]